MSPAERLQTVYHEQSAEIGSMAALARLSGLRPGTVRKYFPGSSDNRNPPLDICERLGKALGVHGAWLFYGRKPKYLKETASERSDDDNFVMRVPLLDFVSAGRLVAPTSQMPIEDVPLLAFADLGPGEFFALTVDGNSMDRVSPHGSVVVVNRRDRTLISGKCYVFAYRGETTYKRWQGGDPAYLDPFSTDTLHKPIFIKRKRDFEVIGRVKRTLLDL